MKTIFYEPHKHSYRLQFIIYSVNKSIGPWWHFQCNCGAKEIVHSSKFWKMF